VQPTWSFECRRCRKTHDGVPLAWGADAPVYYYGIPEAERRPRCDLTPDTCVIDSQHFYVRGLLEIPVIDGPGPFAWIVWCSLSKENFERALAIWAEPGRETEPPYFGWLSTVLPGYPNTLNLKTHVHTRKVGQAPFIEVEPTDHPLALEQRNGIPMSRVQEIAERLLHSA